MHTFDEEIRRVDELFPSGVLLYASSTAARDNKERWMIHTLRYHVQTWVKILNNYLEICDFFAQTHYSRDSSSVRRLEDMIKNYLSQVPPKVVAYMEERVMNNNVPLRYARYNSVPFMLFKTYLAEIYYYFINISLEEERPYLQKIIKDLQVILQTLHGYYLEALQALKELRKDLVDVRNTLDNRMLDFVMGTHDRLGNGSRVSLLGRDTLSIIQDQLNIIDRDSHRDTWPRGEDARRAGER